MTQGDKTIGQKVCKHLTTEPCKNVPNALHKQRTIKKCIMDMTARSTNCKFSSCDFKWAGVDCTTNAKFAHLVLH